MVCGIWFGSWVQNLPGFRPDFKFSQSLYVVVLFARGGFEGLVELWGCVGFGVSKLSKIETASLKPLL